jgi:uncharacterized protein (TIGR03437 family)
MKTITKKITALCAMAVVALMLPVAALADINASAVLSVGQSISLDTGATNTSGTGDITFTGTSLTFIGTAKGGVIPGFTGATSFGQLTQAILQSLAALATSSPIPASSLAVGAIVGVGTNGGNAAKLLVTAISSTSISFQYTTYGASGSGGGTPTVTGVTNNYSFIPSGFTNSGVAPSSIITIFGSNMAAPLTGTLTLQSSAGAGIPTNLNGTSVSVTVNGTTVPLGIYYAIPSQIAAVLPASTPTGTGTITVTYNSAPSNAFTIQVVQSAFGLDTYYGTGNGLITATNASTGALFNYTDSMSPGQTITLWGTGLGADPQDSDTVFTTTPHAVNQGSVQVWIGGSQATVLYAGSSGYPGLSQINVTIPSGVTGCNVAIVVVVNGVTSNFTTGPFNPGGGVCTDPAFGINGTQLTTLSGQTNVKSGDVFLGQSISPNANGAQTTTNFASAIFESVTGSTYGAASGEVSVGSCIVTEVISTGGGNLTTNGLDAGTVSVAGPGGTTYPLTSLAQVPGFYEASLPAAAITSSGGTFTFSWTGGSGATAVGASTATVTLPNPLLNWTNQSVGATVTRAQGVLVTWTGGEPGSFVFISGSSSSSTTGANGNFVCYAPQSALQFMVPSYVTETLPSGTGTLGLENITSYTRFTATGIDYGTAFGFTGVSINSTYQ